MFLQSACGHSFWNRIHLNASLRHSVTTSLCHNITPLLCHFVTASQRPCFITLLRHCVTILLRHNVTASLRHNVAASQRRCVTKRKRNFSIECDVIVAGFVNRLTRVKMFFQRRLCWRKVCVRLRFISFFSYFWGKILKCQYFALYEIVAKCVIVKWCFLV